MTRRLPLVSAASAPEVAPREGRIVPRGRVVVVVPLDEGAALDFARAVVAASERPPIVLLEGPVDAVIPSGLGDARRVALHEPALEALLASDSAFLALGAAFAEQVEASLVVALAKGLPVPVSPALLRVRGHVDAWLDGHRPAFAAWLAGRLRAPA